MEGSESSTQGGTKKQNHEGAVCVVGSYFICRPAAIVDAVTIFKPSFVGNNFWWWGTQPLVFYRTTMLSPGNFSTYMLLANWCGVSRSVECQEVICLVTRRAMSACVECPEGYGQWIFQCSTVMFSLISLKLCCFIFKCGSPLILTLASIFGKSYF
jgi:hypothetical protein